MHLRHRSLIHQWAFMVQLRTISTKKLRNRKLITVEACDRQRSINQNLQTTKVICFEVLLQGFTHCSQLFSKKVGQKRKMANLWPQWVQPLYVVNCSLQTTARRTVADCVTPNSTILHCRIVDAQYHAMKFFWSGGDTMSLLVPSNVITLYVENDRIHIIIIIQFN